MKQLLWGIPILLTMLAGCKKESQYQSAGIITSRSLEKCYCCWGWTISIDGRRYKFNKIPDGSPVDLEKISYPTVVKIQWRNTNNSCSGHIDVLEISKW
jgi:hypothetical protein